MPGRGGDELVWGIRLTADGKDLVGAVKLSRKELDKLGVSTDRARKQGRGWNRQQRESARRARESARAYSAAGSSLSGYIGVLAGGAAFAAFGRNAVRAVDVNLELDGVLQQVTETEVQRLAIEERLFRLSQDTYSQLEANTRFYGRLSQATEELGLSEAKRLRVTRLLNQQMIIGGDQAGSFRSAVVQLVQGLSSGELRGQELRSVMEQALASSASMLRGFRRLYEQGEVAFELTRENIYDLAEQGEITAERLIDALLADAPEIERRWNDITLTLGRSYQQLENSGVRLAGRLEEEQGLVRGLAENVSDLALRLDDVSPESLDRLTGFAKLAAVGIGVQLVSAMGSWSAAQLVARGRSIALGRAVARSTRAVAIKRVRMIAGAAAGRTYGRAMGFAAVGIRSVGRAAKLALGPLGLLLLGGEALLELWLRHRDDAAETAESYDDLGESLDDLALKYEQLDAAGKKSLREDLEERRSAAVAALRAAGREFGAAAVAGGRDLAPRAVASARADIAAGRGPRNRGEEIAQRFAAAVDALEAVQKEVDDAYAALGALEGQVESAARVSAEATAALAALRSENERLAAGGQTVLAAIEAETARREALTRVQEAFPEVSETVLEGLVDEELRRESLIRAIRDQEAANVQAARVIADLRTETQNLAAAYDEKREAVRAATDVTEEERQATLRLLTAEERRERAVLARQEAEEAAEREAATGIARLQELRRENSLIAQGGAAAVAQIERETEFRHLLNEALETYTEAAPDVIQQIVEETMRRQELLTALDEEADRRERLLRLAAAALTPMKNVSKDESEEIDRAERFSRALGTVQEGLQSVSAAASALGDLGGRNRRLFRVQQAAGIALATIATHKNIAQLLGDESLGPYPLRAAMAVVAGVAGAAQIEAIRSTPPPRAFAAGGIIDRRLEFSYGGGRQQGVAGEAGREAIFPLAVGASGELGIRGTGGGNVTIAPRTTIVVEGDAGGLDLEELGRTVNEQIERNLVPVVRRVLIDERRPGGVLERVPAGVRI